MADSDDDLKARFMRAREILAGDPDNPWALVEMAKILHAKGQPDRAETFIERALNLDPFNEEYKRVYEEIRKARGE